MDKHSTSPPERQEKKRPDDKGFAYLPPLFLRNVWRHLSDRARAVLPALLSFMPNVRPSVETIAEMTGKGLTATKQALADLEHACIIRRENQGRSAGGTFKVTRYVVADLRDPATLKAIESAVAGQRKSKGRARDMSHRRRKSAHGSPEAQERPNRGRVGGGTVGARAAEPWARRRPVRYDNGKVEQGEEKQTETTTTDADAEFHVVVAVDSLPLGEVDDAKGEDKWDQQYDALSEDQQMYVDFIGMDLHDCGCFASAIKPLSLAAVHMGWTDAAVRELRIEKDNNPGLRFGWMRKQLQDASAMTVYRHRAEAKERERERRAHQQADIQRQMDESRERNRAAAQALAEKQRAEQRVKAEADRARQAANVIWDSADKAQREAWLVPLWDEHAKVDPDTAARMRPKAGDLARAAQAFFIGTEINALLEAEVAKAGGVDAVLAAHAKGAPF